MNHNDTLAFCAAADALLAAHASDDQITGRARGKAQREFARHAHPTLTLAIEKIRELIAEVAKLRTGINESEGALLRMFSETQSEVEQLREEVIDAEGDTERIEDSLSQIAAYDEELYQAAGESRIQYVVEDVLIRLRTAEDDVVNLSKLMVCGHPGACIVSADEGTAHCAWCEDKACWQALLDMAITNAEGYRELYIESDRKLAALEASLGAEIKLARMRATVGKGSVL